MRHASLWENCGLVGFVCFLRGGVVVVVWFEWGWLVFCVFFFVFLRAGEILIGCFF